MRIEFDEAKVDGSIEEIAQIFKSVEPEDGVVELDCSSIKKVDASFAQLVHALRRHCNAQGWELRLKLDEEVRRYVAFLLEAVVKEG